MIRYTVTWSDDARDDLANFWLEARNKKLVTAHIAMLERELAFDAETKGTPVREGLRRIIISHLSVLFTVETADRIVEVVGLSLIV